MQVFQLNEGLSRGALYGLIQPLLSIDEYESKISDKRIIVVAFFVGESDPANDLSSFIDRSQLSVMDTEVSPSPTPEGHYVVFVELERNKDFPKTLEELLKDVDNLTDVDSWGFVCPQDQNPQELSTENIIKSIILNPDDIVEISDDDTEQQDDLQETNFWKSSVADRYELTESSLIIYKNNTAYHYKILDTQLVENLHFDFKHPQEISTLQNILGPSYNVYGMDDMFIVEHYDDTVILQKTA